MDHDPLCQVIVTGGLEPCDCEPTIRERALALMDGCYMPYEQALDLARSEADTAAEPKP
jgi:hypothetical protein